MSMAHLKKFPCWWRGCHPCRLSGPSAMLSKACEAQHESLPTVVHSYISTLWSFAVVVFFQLEVAFWTAFWDPLP